MTEGRISPLFTWRTAITESDLPPVARHVALTLSMYMSEKGDSAFPAILTLAADTGLAKSTIVKSLRALEVAGYVVVSRAVTKSGSGRGGRSRVNHYRASIPREVSVTQTVVDTDEVPTSKDTGEQTDTRTVPETVVVGILNGPPDSEERSDRTTRERTTTTPGTTSAAIDEKAKPRDPIWDGFVAWLGRSPETKSERGQWNKACGELRAIGVDNALEVERRGRAYQRAYSGIVPTPLGIVAHWSEFGRSPTSEPPWRPSIPEMTDEELAEASHG